METFDSLYRQWTMWKHNESHGEAGSAYSFPQWPQLLAAAEKLLLSPALPPDVLAELAACWAASEEGEELCDFAKSHASECLPVLERLSESSLPACRWQVYDAAAFAGVPGETIIRNGLTDPDSYARRRAVLALSKLGPRDACSLAVSLIKDPDPYMRQASIELILICEDLEFKERSLTELSEDPVAHVREHARRAREPSDRGAGA